MALGVRNHPNQHSGGKAFGPLGGPEQPLGRRLANGTNADPVQIWLPSPDGQRRYQTGNSFCAPFALGTVALKMLQGAPAGANVLRVQAYKCAETQYGSGMLLRDCRGRSWLHCAY